MSSRVNETSPMLGFPGSGFRYTPLEHVRVLFISFLQGLFAEAPPGFLRWDEDEQKTEIIIRDENPIHVGKVGMRPVINFTMGPIQFYSLGIDDMYTYDFDIDRKVKVVLVPGTMSINCCSRVDIEAHNIGWIVGEHIWLLRELLLQAGFFETGRGIQVGPPSPAGSVVANDSGDEWYCSTVSVPFQFSRKSAFTKLGQRIVNNIRLNLGTRMPFVEQGRGGPAISDLGPSVRVDECLPPSFAPNASDARGQTPDPTGIKNKQLPIVPHPLNPAKYVYVETVRPFRASAAKQFSRGTVLPLVRPCVEES